MDELLEEDSKAFWEAMDECRDRGGRSIDREAVENRLRELIDDNIRLIDAKELLATYRIQPEDTKEFWEQHGADSKEQYRELVEALPKLYELIQQEERADLKELDIPYMFAFYMDLMDNDRDLWNKAKLWFEPIYMLRADYIESEGLYFADDGRHRCMIADELDIPIPVIVKKYDTM